MGAPLGSRLVHVRIGVHGFELGGAGVLPVTLSNFQWPPPQFQKGPGCFISSPAGPGTRSVAASFNYILNLTASIPLCLPRSPGKPQTATRLGLGLLIQLSFATPAQRAD